MNAPGAAITATGLTVQRGRRTVLDGLDLAIPRGQLTGLLGPSGCGKTTLMRAIVGVQARVGGEMRVLGEAAGSPVLRTRVSYATQAASVYDDLTVHQNLQYFARVLGGPLLVLFPFILMFVVTSVTTLRERRSGTLERLMTTPLGRGDFIVGYAIAFGLIATVQAVVTVGFAVVVCGLEIDGHIWQLIAVAVLDGLLGTGLGLFASAFARTEFQAVQFMPMFVFPQILLGGLLMPRDQMPDVLHAISNWLPLSYAVDAVNAVRSGGEGWELGWPVIVVAGVSLLALGLAALTLGRRTA